MNCLPDNGKFLERIPCRGASRATGSCYDRHDCTKFLVRRIAVTSDYPGQHLARALVLVYAVSIRTMVLQGGITRPEKASNTEVFVPERFLRTMVR